MSNNSKEELQVKKSFWWSSLSEFCEEVLVPKRKKQGLTQIDISNHTGLSQSEVSRLERGIVKPRDNPTINSIFDAYKLTSSEKKEFIDILTASITIEKVDSTTTSLLDSQIKQISYLARSGSPKIAGNSADLTIDWIESTFGNNLNSEIALRKALLLIESSAAKWDTVKPEFVDNITSNLITKMKCLSEVKYADTLLPETLLTANLGFHLYIKGNYEQSSRLFQKILNDSELKRTNWGIEVLRATAIVAGKTGDRDLLNLLERETSLLIADASTSDTDKGYLLEGLGRGFSEINLSKGLMFLRKANEYINMARKEKDFLNVRFIQVTRSYLSALKMLPTKAIAFYRIAEPALKEAELLGFQRHKSQILEIIR